MVTKDVWQPNLYDEKHSFVFKHGEDLVALLKAKPGERILDVGCGTGHLTARIAATGAHVVGMDNSPTMLEAARRNYPNIEFVQGDASDFKFDVEFDAIFSNAALHWVLAAERAAACMAGALRPGGRFVIEMGGKGNLNCIITAAREAVREIVFVDVEYGKYFPSIGEYATILEKNGLAVRSATLFDRMTALSDGEQGLRHWLEMFAGRFFNNISPKLKDQVITRTEDKLRPKLFYDGSWHADYRRLRIVAYKREF